MDHMAEWAWWSGLAVAGGEHAVDLVRAHARDGYPLVRAMRVLGDRAVLNGSEEGSGTCCARRIVPLADLGVRDRRPSRAGDGTTVGVGLTDVADRQVRAHRSTDTCASNIRPAWARASAGMPVPYARAVERTPLQDAVDGWLAEGPLPVEELAERAVTAGLVSPDLDDEGVGPEHHVEWLLERSDAYWSARAHTDDEVVVLARTFTESGMTFTHRVTAEELEAEALDDMPDLSVLLWECRRGLSLDDASGPVEVDYSEMAKPRLAGPSDWIEAVTPGDLLVFTRTDGVLSVAVIDEEELGAGKAEMRALIETASVWIGDGRGSEELPVVMEALAREPTLFRSPVPPVGELLEAIGLERRGHEWGWADEEWQTRQETFKGHDSAIRRLYGFDRCCDRAYERVTDSWLAHTGGAEVDGRALADDLGHGSVTAAFVHAHADAPTLLIRFASALVDTATGRHAAPPLTLLGLAHLRAADPVQAYEALGAAMRADPDFPAAAGALALLELDRGNVSRAHTLAIRDGVDPGLVEWIGDERERQGSLRPTAARNDPCPCGSGRKFKRCCAAGGPLALAQRVPFVLQRIAHYASGPEGHDTLFGLALSAVDGHENVVDAMGRFLEEPFLVDIAIHEGGLGDDYADQRGPLLADDEVALLQQVLDEPRRLWEITAVAQGESLTLRDTGSGDELTVTEHAGSRGREPGELMLARTTTVDGEPMLFGTSLLVPLRDRDRVLRMLDGWVGADGLAMWFGSLFLPPRMANREGEELVLRRTVCEIHDDADAVTAALDETYEREGDELVWHEMFEVDGHDRVVRGTLRLDEGILTIESNSEERQERMLATLDELVEYTIADDGEIDDFDTGDEDAESFGPSDPDDMPEEVRELVERSIREYEQRWVDESVPALGDLTPRQALDDPTRREDLLALLRGMRSHEPPEGAIGMSVDRIERLLGIERR